MPSVQHTECDELSLYTDTPATPDQIKQELKKLVSAFPDIDNQYVIVLIDRMVANRFTRNRVFDAINNIIDNCHYKRPMIAEIVGFDKKVRLYTYSEMLSKCTPQYTTENFESIELDGKIRWFEK